MVNGKDNVIPLKAAIGAKMGARHSQQTAAAQTGALKGFKLPVHAPVESLPRALQALHLLLSKTLQQGLSQLFSEADDVLFERANLAGSNIDQSVYFDAMRSIRLARSQLAQDCFTQLRQAFMDLAKPQPAYSVAAEPVDYDTLELSADDVTLVSDDALEEEVAIKSMVEKYLQNHTVPIDHLWRRCFHLLDKRGKNDIARLPSHPKALAEGFVNLLDSMSLQIKIKLLLLKLFERTVLKRFCEIYPKINDRLASQGILPDLQRQISQERRQKFNQRRRGAAANTLVQGQALGELHQLIGSQPSALFNDAALPESPGATELPVLSSEQLCGLVAQLQNTRMNSSENSQSDQIATRLHQLVAERGNVSQLDKNIINLVHMLFEYIWEDPNLASPMRALLSRMQIPLIKVALVDASFLQAGSHPARQLLNEMARCALGWDEAREMVGGKPDSLLNQLEVIVARVQDEFDEDINLFTELHQQLRKFLDRELRRADLVTQRTVDQARGQALAQDAKELVAAVLGELLKGYDAPPSAKALLLQAWSRVMQMEALKHGAETEAWTNKLNIAKQFIDCLMNPPANANVDESRDAFDHTIGLMERELSEVGLDTFQTRKWFEPVEKYFKQTLLKQDSAEDLNFAWNTIEPQADDLQANAKMNPGQNTLPRETAVNVADNIESEEHSLKSNLVDGMGSRKEGEPSSGVSTSQELERRVVDTESEAVIDEINSVKEPEQKSGEEKNQSVAVEIAENDPAMKQARRLGKGAWMQHTAEGSHRRCRLAAILPAVGRYIFVDRQGKKILELNLQELALSLKSKSLIILDEGQLFDRALQAVIGGLRKQQP